MRFWGIGSIAKLGDEMRRWHFRGSPASVTIVRRHDRFVFAMALLCAVCPPATGDETASFDSGLEVLYDFRDDRGQLVRDQSGASNPIHLQLAELEGVTRQAGALTLTEGGRLQTLEPPRRLVEAIRRTGECTVEAWVQAADEKQKGPARIVSLSRSASARNLTLGQDGTRFDVRFRTTTTSGNGIPSTQTEPRTVNRQLTHVLYSRSRTGNAKIFLNGKLSAERQVEGDLSNWDKNCQLVLGDEVGGGRAWRGTFFRVAIYSQAFSAERAVAHFERGLDTPYFAQQRKAKRARRAAETFETQVAPILANHCLECHDAVVAEGGLDLSRRATAFAGGTNGAAITPGDRDASPLWELVEADAMPHERPALSDDEKQVLADWIDAGATWSLDRLDPATYAHATGRREMFLRRLTIDEYIATVRAATGVDIAAEAREWLPPDVAADGFKNTAYNLSVDLKHVHAFAELAASIVAKMDTTTFARRFSKSRRLTDKNMRQLIEKIGRHLLRGPLDSHEIDLYRGISTTVMSSGGDFEEAVATIVEAMLQSPRFLYRVERQRGDGSPWPVSPFELASRISYFVWGGPPDAHLTRAALKGRLDRDDAERQATRMLADPRATEQAERFVVQWLKLDRLRDLRPKNASAWDANLTEDMRRETIAFWNEIAHRQERPLVDLFDAQVTFLTPRLAQHYEIPLPDSGQQPRSTSDQEAELIRVDLRDIPSRGGLLTQASTLTVGGEEASMVTRGLFVFHDLLRGVVRDPPPCVDTSPVPTEPGRTQRAIAEQRIANESCGGCHRRFEPFAFGLERFDGFGRYRAQDEHGNPLREDGEIAIVGEREPRQFSSADEMMELLSQSDRTAETITWKLTQFAVGRPLAARDARAVAEIHRASQEAGGTYASLVRAIVRSDLFHLTPTEPRQ